MYFAEIVRRFDGPVRESIGGRQEDWTHPMLTLLTVLIIAGVAVYLIKAVTQSKATNQEEKRDPLDFAKERFAKGEISKEELSEIKKELK